MQQEFSWNAFYVRVINNCRHPYWSHAKCTINRKTLNVPTTISSVQGALTVHYKTLITDPAIKVAIHFSLYDLALSHWIIDKYDTTPATRRIPKTVADLGFPRGGCANPRGGAPTYYLTNFFRKLHENEEILVQRWGRASLAPPPLDPPLQEWRHVKWKWEPLGPKWMRAGSR